MKNLNAHIESAIDFFDNVLAAKNRTENDPTYNARVTLLRPNIITAYTLYDDAFAADNLVAMGAHGYAAPPKDDLLKMYKYKNKPFQKLKTAITTTARKRIINTCQNCTINEINSFDHLLPKDEFPEFAVNPKNLFPSCTQCNGYKNVVWRHNGSTLFLNLYLDILPIEQYLFVDVTITDTVDAIFVVDNRNNINLQTFDLVSSHYRRLHLTDRFRLNRDDVVSELINTIKEMILMLTEQQIREVLINKSNRDRLNLGSNYWKSILAIELINSHAFFEFAINY
ncbi:hypothetical protein [Flavobacterium aquatile]|uniref:HNH domain-containing protein n=1 Tax=Flavobacterium aquatile LMG 4008 = ATCC 11947 TaxID=1453498 RepID=A0A095SQV6_9FLAO|nr:hypothetical protein [Flavobacterium aquatile]KGD66967.1 hypothetical protein LG45_16250 [Flavobacterium aquatile LMG 4008 = ATCC 11947]OXA68062.1 hypothetical protein B0A61_06235 [Flavobacterium aquatile LMG 4008 = ATCC 11947]GEC80095.1 hypothetical protein FAQ01_29650 [Flavobacterium aquatile]